MHFPSSMVFSAQIQRDSWSHVVRAIFADVPLGKLAKNPRFIENTENTWILTKFQQNQAFLCVYGKMFLVSAIFADVSLGKVGKNPRFIVNTKNTLILMKLKQNQVFLGVY